VVADEAARLEGCAQVPATPGFSTLYPTDPAPKIHTLNPIPYTLSLKPLTLNSKSLTRNLKTQTLKL
jgi:hypothetical protein